MSDKVISRVRKLPDVATVMAHLQAGLTPEQIAKVYSVSESGVRDFLSRNHISLMALKNWKRNNADLLALKQAQIVEAMTDEKIGGASLRDQAGALASLNNVERLARGQSTQNIDILEVTAQLEDLTATENEIRRRMGLPEIPTTSVMLEGPSKADGQQE